MVIDPSVHQPEISAFNQITALSSIRCTYHLPALCNEDTMTFEIERSSGIILLGSSSSVHDQLEWKDKLFHTILKAIELDMPILGICYGHQLIAHLFNGKVGYLWDKVKKRGTRAVNVRENKLWGNATSGSLMFSHEEGVVTCPDHFSISATSDDVLIEGLAHNTKPIWTFQCHIEGTLPFAQRGNISNENFAKAYPFGTFFLKKFIQFVEN